MLCRSPDQPSCVWVWPWVNAMNRLESNTPSEVCRDWCKEAPWWVASISRNWPRLDNCLSRIVVSWASTGKKSHYTTYSHVEQKPRNQLTQHTLICNINHAVFERMLWEPVEHRQTRAMRSGQDGPVCLTFEKLGNTAFLFPSLRVFCLSFKKKVETSLDRGL